MKQVYFFDKNKVFTHVELIENETKIPNNSTLKAPRTEVGYEPYTFNGDDWEGVSEEEYLKAHPQPTPILPLPNATDKAIAQIALNQATQKVEQDKFNADVLLQIAKMGGIK